MKKLRTPKTPSGFQIRKPGEVQTQVLDAIDRRILNLMQRDATISNLDLAEQVGLSPPACLKRVRLLRSAGVITGTVAILSPEVLGYPLLTVARVKLELPNENANKVFEARMAELPRVVQCMTVAGDFDYILLIRSRDVAHYQDFARKVLKLMPGIRSYTSEIVLQVHKSTTALPIDPA